MAFLGTGISNAYILAWRVVTCTIDDESTSYSYQRELLARPQEESIRWLSSMQTRSDVLARSLELALRIH